MRLLWLHKPHPCKTCGVELVIAYPTCATEACRTAWRRKSQNAATKARRAAQVEARRCRECRKLLPQTVTTVRCKACLRKDRVDHRERHLDAAFQAYKEKLALARAEREIERRIARRTAEEREEQERAFKEVREMGERGWMNDDGEVMYDEI